MERKAQLEAAENLREAVRLRFAYPAQDEDDLDERAIILRQWSRAAMGLPEEGPDLPPGFTREPGAVYVRTADQFNRALERFAVTPKDRTVLGLPPKE